MRGRVDQKRTPQPIPHPGQEVGNLGMSKRVFSFVTLLIFMEKNDYEYSERRKSENTLKPNV